MGAFNSAVITAKGQALLAKAVLNTVDLEFTRIAVSENKLTGDLVSKTGIGTVKQGAKVASVKRTNNSSVKVSASIANNDLTSGYYVRNIGLYAKDPDEGEILYSISVADEGSATADWMPPYNGVGVSSLMIDLVTVVGNSDNVKVEVDPTAFATVAQIVEVNEHLTALDNTITTTTEKTLRGSVAGGLKINSVGGMTRKCTNLLPYPYSDGSKTSNGITYTVNNDGTVIANGTAVDYNATIYLARNLELPAGTYKVVYNETSIKGGSLVVMKNGSYLMDVHNTSDITIETGDTISLYMQFVPSVTASNVTLKPRINIGEIQPHEPYFEGLRSVEINKVITHGKNLVKCAYFPTANNYDSLVKMEKVANVIKGHTYTISVDLEASQATQAYWNANSSIYHFKYFEVLAGKHRYSYTFTALSDATLEKQLLLSKDNKSDGITITPSNCQIEEGSVATEYEPYKENFITLSQPIILDGIPVSSGGNTIDENGQRWLCDELDLENGRFVKRIGRVDMGTLNWKTNAVGKFYEDTFFHSVCVNTDTHNIANILTAKYKTVSNYEFESSFPDKSVSFYNYQSSPGGTLKVCDSAYSDWNSFVTAMSGVMLYYELAEPVITDIPDILSIADQISFHSLLVHDSVTYLLTDSKETPVIEVEYGTNKTGAHTLTGLLTAQRNELKLMELTSAVLALNQE